MKTLYIVGGSLLVACGLGYVVYRNQGKPFREIAERLNARGTARSVWGRVVKAAAGLVHTEAPSNPAGEHPIRPEYSQHD